MIRKWVLCREVYKVNFEDLPTEKIYKYMPFSGFSHKLLFRFDGLKPCCYKNHNMDDVVTIFNGCYVVENNWHEVFGACDFFSLLWFSTINNQLWGTEFYCKKGLLKDFYEKFILSSQNLYDSEDWVGEDGKLTYSYDLSHEGFIFERRVRYI